MAKRSGLVSSPDSILRLQRSGYPSRLKALSAPPEWLEVRGQPSIIEDELRAVAIVGSRAASTAEMSAAYELARALAERGTVVVSGGATGVDTAAHRGALAAVSMNERGGRCGATVAVLGCGVEVTYPERNRDLFHEICARGGALVSQFESLAPPRPWHFVRRNEIIAALCDAVIVIAAGARSGALHTARAARKLGRVVGAMPGRAGCNALIAAGAALVRDIHDLEDALAGIAVGPIVTLPESDTLSFLILSCLRGANPRDINDINLETGLAVRDIHRVLTSLELDGLVVLKPGRRFVCSHLARELLAS